MDIEQQTLKIKSENGINLSKYPTFSAMAIHPTKSVTIIGLVYSHYIVILTTPNQQIEQTPLFTKVKEINLQLDVSINQNNYEFEEERKKQFFLEQFKKNFPLETSENLICAEFGFIDNEVCLVMAGDLGILWILRTQGWQIDRFKVHVNNLKFAEYNEHFDYQNLMFTSSKDALIKLHNLKTKQTLANFHDTLNEIPFSPVLGINLSFDSSMLISSTNNGYIHIFDLRQIELMKKINDVNSNIQYIKPIFIQNATKTIKGIYGFEMENIENIFHFQNFAISKNIEGLVYISVINDTFDIPYSNMITQLDFKFDKVRWNTQFELSIYEEKIFIGSNGCIYEFDISYDAFEKMYNSKNNIIPYTKQYKIEGSNEFVQFLKLPSVNLTSKDLFALQGNKLIKINY